MLEVLFFQIRNDKSVRGFKTGNIEVKLTAFADDTTFFVKDEPSLQRILKVMSLYSKYSSLRANCEKCKASWIGGSKTSYEKPVNCRWVSLVSGTIKILGIHFSYNKKLVQKESFTNTVTYCKRILGKWKQRWLTVLGRIQVFKLLIASKPVYNAIMKTVSQEFSEALANLQKDFIWGGRKPKIKHATLIVDYKDGGLKDVDIDSKFESLKFMWIQKLKGGSNHHPWKALAQKILEKCDSDYIFHYNLKLSKSSVKAVRELLSFYRELILLWETISSCSKLTNSGILSQYLWNHLCITSSLNETLFCQNLIRKI